MARHEKVTPITILLSDNILSRWVRARERELDAYEFLKHAYDPNHIAGLLRGYRADAHENARASGWKAPSPSAP